MGGGNFLACPARQGNGRHAPEGVHDLRPAQPQWRARPDTELHATAQKNLMTFEIKGPAEYWPIYKGASFDIWDPDTGVYYAWADPTPVLEWLQSKRLHGQEIREARIMNSRRSFCTIRQPFHVSRPELRFGTSPIAPIRGLSLLALCRPKCSLPIAALISYGHAVMRKSKHFCSVCCDQYLLTGTHVDLLKHT